MFIPENQTCGHIHIVLAQVHLCYGLAVITPNVVLCLFCTAGLCRSIVPWKRYVFVLNLSIADGLFGLCAAVMALLIMYDCTGTKFMGLVGVGGCMSVIQTIHGHISISVMQYWAVKRPLFYGIQIRHRCCSLVISLSWLLALVYGGMEWFIFDQYGPLRIRQWTIFFLILLGCCIFMNLSLNLYVAYAVLQHHNRRRQNTQTIISRPPRLVASASAPSINYNNTTSFACTGNCSNNANSNTNNNNTIALGKHRHQSALAHRCSHRYCSDYKCAMEISNQTADCTSDYNNNHHRCVNPTSGHLISCHYNQFTAESSPTITTAILQHSPRSTANFSLLPANYPIPGSATSPDLYFQHPLHQLLTTSNHKAQRGPGSDSSLDSLSQMLNGGNVSPKQSGGSTADAAEAGCQFTTNTNSTTSSPGVKLRRGSSKRSRTSIISKLLNTQTSATSTAGDTAIGNKTNNNNSNTKNNNNNNCNNSNYGGNCKPSTIDRRHSQTLVLDPSLGDRRKSSIHLDQISRQHRYNMITVVINICIFTFSYIPPWLLTLYMLLAEPPDETRVVLTVVATACFMFRSLTDPIVHLVRESRFHSCRLFHGPKYQSDMKFSNASVESTSPYHTNHLTRGFV